MRKFWSLFWKIFGVALLVMFFTAIVTGIVKHSLAPVYTILQWTLAYGLGLCGIMGFVIVPLEMYLEDRSQKKRSSP